MLDARTFRGRTFRGAEIFGRIDTSVTSYARHANGLHRSGAAHVWFPQPAAQMRHLSACPSTRSSRAFALLVRVSNVPPPARSAFLCACIIEAPIHSQMKTLRTYTGSDGSEGKRRVAEHGRLGVTTLDNTSRTKLGVCLRGFEVTALHDV